MDGKLNSKKQSSVPAVITVGTASKHLISAKPLGYVIKMIIGIPGVFISIHLRAMCISYPSNFSLRHVLCRVALDQILILAVDQSILF